MIAYGSIILISAVEDIGTFVDAGEAPVKVFEEPVEIIGDALGDVGGAIEEVFDIF